MLVTSLSRTQQITSYCGTLHAAKGILNRGKLIYSGALQIRSMSNSLDYSQLGGGAR